MPVALSSFLLAFCGIIYELALAQTNSVLLGNSALQYGLTIGLFMAGMGVGAWRESHPEARSALIRLQHILAWLAPLGYLLLWAGALVLPAWSLWAPSLVLIFSIGFLSGRELPLLMAMAGPGRAPLVLAFDYFGMLAAAIAFPYWLLPQWGTLGSVAIAALLNALTIQLMRPARAWRYVWPALAAATLLLFQQPVWQWFSQQYAPL